MFQKGDTVEDDTAVHLQLCLTRSAKTHGTFSTTRTGTTTLTFKVGPETLEAGEHIAVLGQFNLSLGIGGLGTHGKNVENQRGTVQNLYLQLCFDVAYLLGTQLIVENDHTYLALCISLALYIFFNFLKFALTYIGNLAGAGQTLCETFHGDCSGCISQKLQFIKIFFGLGLVLVFGNQSHQYGGLSFDFGYYKFFHASIKC